MSYKTIGAVKQVKSLGQLSTQQVTPNANADTLQIGTHQNAKPVIKPDYYWPTQNRWQSGDYN
jgi:hypothetical protein